MNRPTRILHVFGQMNRGGAELRTLEVMRHLDRSRFQMDYCVLSGRRGDLDDEIRALGGEVHPCPLGPGFPRRFRALLRERRPDVVHSHVLYFSGFPLLLAHRAGVPVRVAHFRSTGGEQSLNLRRSVQNTLLRRWIDHHATDILSVSRGSMDEAWARYRSIDGRCRVIHNGLDLQPFSGGESGVSVRDEFSLDAGVRLCVHVGRFVPAKNHARVVALFAAIAAGDPGAHLLLVGAGGTEAEARCRERVAELGLDHRVTFVGVRNDVPRLLRAADLLLLPSLREGLPGVVLEACAAGAPVLASDLSGCREIAEQFPAVTCLPLRASDAEWARVATNVCGMRVDQATALARYRASDFTLEASIDALTGVWTRAERDDYGR